VTGLTYCVGAFNNSGMEDALETEARLLKEKWPERYHPQIDRNLRWVSKEMDAKPGGVALQEGLIALTEGLPSQVPPARQERKTAVRRGITRKNRREG
jgi:hypothetical protein